MGDIMVIEKEMTPLIELVRTFIIKDESTYLLASEIAGEMKRKIEERRKELEPPKQSAWKSYQDAQALYKKYVENPLELVKALDRRAYQWQNAEKEKVKAETERLRKEAEKKQEDDRLALAERLESSGMTEQADEVLSAPMEAIVIQQSAPIARPAGQTNVENWQATIVNADLVPREWCCPDTVKIGKYGKVMKGEARIEGVKFEDVGSIRRPRS